MSSHRSAFLVVLFLIGFAGDAAAQTSSGADATTSIEVLSALTMTNNSLIDFGQVFNNGQQTADLNPENGTVMGNSPQGNPTVGKFTADGQNNTAITVSFDPSVTLTGPGSDLTFTPDVRGSASDNGASAGSGASQMQEGSTVNTNSSGKYFFWVGGQVPVSDGQQQGEYSGTFTMSVEYTNL